MKKVYLDRPWGLGFEPDQGGSRFAVINYCEDSVCVDVYRSNGNPGRLHHGSIPNAAGGDHGGLGKAQTGLVYCMH